jgi:hypothetical protein
MDQQIYEFRRPDMVGFQILELVALQERKAREKVDPNTLALAVLTVDAPQTAAPKSTLKARPPLLQVSFERCSAVYFFASSRMACKESWIFCLCWNESDKEGEVATQDVRDSRDGLPTVLL